MILLVDNYDSFTFNLFQAVSALAFGEEVRVIRNDAATADEVAGWRPRVVLLSPGPGHPADAGLSLSMPSRLPETPMLGVCLGHQALAHAAGARVSRAPRPRHGQPVAIHHDGLELFAGLPSPFPAALYHSLIVEQDSLPEDWIVCARTGDGDIMGLRHRGRPHCGVQFHPESFMTDLGPQILSRLLA